MRARREWTPNLRFCVGGASVVVAVAGRRPWTTPVVAACWKDGRPVSSSPALPCPPLPVPCLIGGQGRDNGVWEARSAVVEAIGKAGGVDAGRWGRTNWSRFGRTGGEGGDFIQPFPTSHPVGKGRNNVPARKGTTHFTIYFPPPTGGTDGPPPWPPTLRSPTSLPTAAVLPPVCRPAPRPSSAPPPRPQPTGRLPVPWPSLQTFPVVGGTSGAPQVLVTNWLRPRPHEPAVALSDQLVAALVRGGRDGTDRTASPSTTSRPPIDQLVPLATAGRPFPHALTNWSCHRHRAYHQVPRP